jgi:tetraacyldisaccharide 4'-kinase
MAACVARLLLEAGERPSILSRGYARRDRRDGVVIVRDADRIRADLDRAGDEPLMLARQLPGVAILACADRYLAGRLAEHRLGCTVHVLDDGFQHLQLDRDVDLLIVARDDFARPHTLPFGRLREPIDTLIVADAILTADEDVVVEPAEVAPPVFHVRRYPLPGPDTDGPAFAFAGIAGPARFFDDLRSAGWTLSETLDFRDHHAYTTGDLSRIVERARASGAKRIVTTEKDMVRLLRFRPFPQPIASVPLRVEPQPLEPFRDWLSAALRSARDLHE